MRAVRPRCLLFFTFQLAWKQSWFVFGLHSGNILLKLGVHVSIGYGIIEKNKVTGKSKFPLEKFKNGDFWATHT
jgi:hypothetical protein